MLDSDVERLMKRLEQRPTMVHVVLLSGQAQASVGNQIEVGLAVTKYTGGQFDSINSADTPGDPAARDRRVGRHEP